MLDPFNQPTWLLVSVGTPSRLLITSFLSSIDSSGSTTALISVSDSSMPGSWSSSSSLSGGRFSIINNHMKTGLQGF